MSTPCDLVLLSMDTSAATSRVDEPGDASRTAARSAPDCRTLVAAAQPRLLEALVARYGPEVGGEAAADAIEWALAHEDRLDGVRNMVAYLYRVGQSKARPTLRWNSRRADPLADDRLVAVEVRQIDPGLVDALRKLSPDQRAAVLLVHAYGWTIAEVADLRGVAVTAVTNHLRRGLTKLRTLLPEDDQ